MVCRKHKVSDGINKQNALKEDWNSLGENMVYFSLNIISLPLVMNKGSFIDVIVYKDGFYLYM